jgi:phosphoribosylformimino-5-aminoimidazole carboxamide ribotide isomerase
MIHLIPVIDLKNGIAVHAKLGLREKYLPLKTPLCGSCVVEDVIDAFLTLYPFKIIYLADLNSIMRQGNHEKLIQHLVSYYPHIIFWVDSGYQAHPSSLINFDNYQPVLGSECYSEAQLSALALFEKKFILSLDFSAQQQPLGALCLFNEPTLWSEKVIVMTLSRVGSGIGVDSEKLQHFQRMNTQTTFVAAGGIRDKNDIMLLKTLGIEYALCASALHLGTINRKILENIQ